MLVENGGMPPFYQYFAGLRILLKTYCVDFSLISQDNKIAINEYLVVFLE
jgi:hypothetical protein